MLQQYIIDAYFPEQLVAATPQVREPALAD
jgi:hypothetical protein